MPADPLLSQRILDEDPSGKPKAEYEDHKCSL